MLYAVREGLLIQRLIAASRSGRSPESAAGQHERGKRHLVHLSCCLVYEGVLSILGLKLKQTTVYDDLLFVNVTDEPKLDDLDLLT